MASLSGEGLTILPYDDVGMEMLSAKRTMPKVLCCICGISMDPNPANKCVNCLRTEVDITDGIPKSILLYQCRGCGRYLRPGWVSAELESRELLAVCLKKITGLSRIKLVDAGFIWCVSFGTSQRSGKGGLLPNGCQQRRISSPGRSLTRDACA